MTDVSEVLDPLFLPMLLGCLALGWFTSSYIYPLAASGGYILLSLAANAYLAAKYQSYDRYFQKFYGDVLGPLVYGPLLSFGAYYMSSFVKLSVSD